MTTSTAGVRTLVAGTPQLIVHLRRVPDERLRAADLVVTTAVVTTATVAIATTGMTDSELSRVDGVQGRHRPNVVLVGRADGIPPADGFSGRG